MFWLADVFNGPFTPEEMHRREQWARRERADTLRRLFSGAGRGLARGAAAIASTLRARHRRRRAIRDLRGLDDHMLADIGLTRDDLYLLNRGVLPTRLADAPAPERAVGAARRVRADAATQVDAGGEEQGKPTNWRQAA